MTTCSNLLRGLLPATWRGRGEIMMAAAAVDARFPGIGADLVLLMLAESRAGAPEPRDADLRCVLHELLAVLGGAEQEPRLSPRPTEAVTP